MSYLSVNEYKYGKIKHKVYLHYGGGYMRLYTVRGHVQDAVRAALHSEGVDKPCVINVLVTNDKGIRCYNRDYRNIDSATDVLSFPMQVFSHAGWIGLENAEFDEGTGLLPLGDIVISSETVKRQSEEYKNNIFYEWDYLTIHSTLHLLGYDHDNETNEKIMHDKAESIMRKLGT